MRTNNIQIWILIFAINSLVLAGCLQQPSQQQQTNASEPAAVTNVTQPLTEVDTTKLIDNPDLLNDEFTSIYSDLDAVSE